MKLSFEMTPKGDIAYRPYRAICFRFFAWAILLKDKYFTLPSEESPSAPEVRTFAVGPVRFTVRRIRDLRYGITR